MIVKVMSAAILLYCGYTTLTNWGPCLYLKYLKHTMNRQEIDDMLDETVPDETVPDETV